MEHKSRPGNFTQIIAIQVIKDAHLKQVLLKSQKFETMAVGLVQFYHLLAQDFMSPEQKTSINGFLKNLFFYIHQNFLIVIQIMLSRMVIKKGNFWATNCEKTLE